MRKKVLDEIAVAEFADIHFSPYDRGGVTTEEGKFLGLENADTGRTVENR
jgi:hypothetical protein